MPSPGSAPPRDLDMNVGHLSMSFGCLGTLSKKVPVKSFDNFSVGLYIVSD